jgi:hypothetical protein
MSTADGLAAGAADLESRSTDTCDCCCTFPKCSSLRGSTHVLTSRRARTCCWCSPGLARTTAPDSTAGHLPRTPHSRARPSPNRPQCSSGTCTTPSRFHRRSRPRRDIRPRRRRRPSRLLQLPCRHRRRSTRRRDTGCPRNRARQEHRTSCRSCCKRHRPPCRTRLRCSSFRSSSRLRHRTFRRNPHDTCLSPRCRSPGRLPRSGRSRSTRRWRTRTLRSRARRAHHTRQTCRSCRPCLAKSPKRQWRHNGPTPARSTHRPDTAPSPDRAPVRAHRSIHRHSCPNRPCRIHKWLRCPHSPDCSCSNPCRTCGSCSTAGPQRRTRRCTRRSDTLCRASCNCRTAGSTPVRDRRTRRTNPRCTWPTRSCTWSPPRCTS